MQLAVLKFIEWNLFLCCVCYILFKLYFLSFFFFIKQNLHSWKIDWIKYVWNNSWGWGGLRAFICYGYKRVFVGFFLFVLFDISFNHHVITFYFCILFFLISPLVLYFIGKIVLGLKRLFLYICFSIECI